MPTFMFVGCIRYSLDSTFPYMYITGQKALRIIIVLSSVLIHSTGTSSLLRGKL